MPGLPGLDGERVSSFNHLQYPGDLHLTVPPQTESSWDVSAALRQGYKGSKGDMGMPGASGEKGVTGLPGLPVRSD